MSDTAEIQIPQILKMQVPLLQLQVYLSEGCSLSCRNCSCSSDITHGESARFLPLDLFSQAIRQARPLGLQSVRLSGPQTLQHPEIIDVLDDLQRQSLNVVVEASSEGITPKLARRLARMHSVSVSIGLDGANAETHDQLNGVPGQFRRVVATARMISKAGLAPEIVTNLKRLNAGQLPDLIRLAEKLHAGSIHFVLPQPSLEQNSSDPTTNLEVAELIALCHKVEHQLVPKTQLKLQYGAPPAFRGLHPMARIEGQGRCNLLNNLSLLASGEFAFCGIGRRIPELVFGQVNQVLLEALWKDNPLLKELRDGMPEKLYGICKHCIMKTACLGNCAAENYVQTGSFFSPYWFCETASQAGLFPAGRLIENIW